MRCSHCAGEIPPNILACPNCHALVHAAELKTLAGDAEAETARGDYTTALTHWRRALELLPSNSSQHIAIRAKVNDLVQRLETHAPVERPKKPKWASLGGTLGVVGLLLWKFKFVVVFLLTKAKLLLFGLTKASTFFSMLLSIGVYWTLWGWKFALGFVLSIYVHEMGHIWQLRRYGIKATAPMFIPGLGAVIRIKQMPASPHEEARYGLAGPVWGLGAAIFCYLVYLATGASIFAAIAKVGAWINLFNLLPVWQLDGNHAFKALTRNERGVIAGLMGILWFTTTDGLLLILALVAAFRTFQKDVPAARNTAILVEFIVLLVTLSALSVINVPLPGREAAGP